MAQDFAEQFSISFPIYTDPQKESYQKMGWKRKFGLSLQSFSQGWRYAKQGFRQGKVMGDPWQQGGEALLLQDGSVWWSNPIDTAGAHSTAKEIIQLIDRFAKEMESQQDPKRTPV